MARDQPIQTPKTAANSADPARIGLFWGILFAVPWVALALITLGDHKRSYVRYMAEAALVYAAPLLLALAGWSWARRREELLSWNYRLVAAAGLGTALILMFAGGLTIEGSFSAGHIKPWFVAWSIAAAWTFALLTIISFRVRRALGRAALGDSSSNEDPAVAFPTVNRADRAATFFRGRRFVFAIVAALGTPWLLAAPALLWIGHDTRAYVRAAARLSQQIAEIEPHIRDVQDFEAVNAGILTKQAILHVLEPAVTQTVDALSVIGELPTDLRLQTLETDSRGISLVVRDASASSESALIDLIRRNRFRDVQVAHPPLQDQDHIEVATITATSSRIDAK